MRLVTDLFSDMCQSQPSDCVGSQAFVLASLITSHRECELCDMPYAGFSEPRYGFVAVATAGDP